MTSDSTGIRCILDVRLDADHLIKALETRHTVLELFGEVYEFSDRLGEVINVKKEGDQVLKSQLVLSDHVGADCHHADGDQSGDAPQNGVVDRHISVVVPLALKKQIISLGKLMDLHILTGKGLDDADAGKTVLHPGVDLCDAFTVLFESAAHFPVEYGSKDDHKGNGDHGHQGKPDIDHT